VAGSSHEGLPGIAETARFFLATSPQEAREILHQHEVRWVLAAESDRVVANSAASSLGPRRRMRSAEFWTERRRGRRDFSP